MKIAATSCLGALLIPLVLFAADEPGITRQQADEILKELHQLQQTLQQMSGPPRSQARGPVAASANVSLKLANANFIGAENAPLTMVEFTDYQCPFCRQFHLGTFNELKKNYVDTGLMRFYSRDLPVDMHKNALQAAQAARCAGDQGQFWQLRNLLQSSPEQVAREDLSRYAQDLKLNTDQFQDCLTTEKYRKAVEADAAEAKGIGANGTPAFVVGKSTPNGVDGQLMMGALPYQAFDQKLKEFSSK